MSRREHRQRNLAAVVCMGRGSLEGAVQKVNCAEPGSRSVASALPQLDSQGMQQKRPSHKAASPLIATATYSTTLPRYQNPGGLQGKSRMAGSVGPLPRPRRALSVWPVSLSGSLAHPDHTLTGLPPGTALRDSPVTG